MVAGNIGASGGGGTGGGTGATNGDGGQNGAGSGSNTSGGGGTQGGTGTGTSTTSGGEGSGGNQGQGGTGNKGIGGQNGAGSAGNNGGNTGPGGTTEASGTQSSGGAGGGVALAQVIGGATANGPGGASTGGSASTGSPYFSTFATSLSGLGLIAISGPGEGVTSASAGATTGVSLIIASATKNSGASDSGAEESAPWWPWIESTSALRGAASAAQEDSFWPWLGNVDAGDPASVPLNEPQVHSGMPKQYGQPDVFAPTEREDFLLPQAGDRWEAVRARKSSMRFSPALPRKTRLLGRRTRGSLANGRRPSSATGWLVWE
jgi:hypothetical protein